MCVYVYYVERFAHIELNPFATMCCVSGETILNILGCGCYFIVECYGSVACGWRCSVGYTVYGLLKMDVLCL